MAAVVLLGLVHAGGRYFYCEAMGLALSDPCARVASRGSGESPLPGMQSQRGDCCSVLVLRAMPDGVRGAGSNVPRSPAVATLPATALVDNGEPRVDGPPRMAFGRSSAPPKPPGETRAHLMVFLI